MSSHSVPRASPRYRLSPRVRKSGGPQPDRHMPVLEREVEESVCRSEATPQRSHIEIHHRPIPMARTKKMQYPRSHDVIIDGR